MEQDTDNVKKAVATLIISDDAKILAVSRKDDHTMWSMPGGKVDPGEDALTAAARELKEETGLEANQLTPVLTQFDGEYLCTTFACSVSGNIDTDEEGLVRWVSPKILVDQNTSPFYEYNFKLLKTLGYV